MDRNCMRLKKSRHGSNLHGPKKVDIDLNCIETKNIDMDPNCMGLKKRNGSKLHGTKK